jgi:putative two-component system response regulator
MPRARCPMDSATAPRPLVLVVEDDVLISGLLVRLLKGKNYEAEAVADGEAALAAVERRPPDLILLDVGLPGADGFAVCRALKARPGMRLTPVVLVTASNDRDARIKGIEAGADDFLSKPYDAEELTARVASLVRLKRYTDELESAESVITSLALTVEARDPYTGGHCQRLAAYATLLGSSLGLAPAQLEALHRGGYLHDVGKIGIPDTVLQKPGKLTPVEFQIMMAHSTIGESLCGSLRSLHAVRAIVRSHHEQRDGSGYPDGLRGDEIPLLAQIIGIVDAYDAMTTTRPYRTALPIAVACDELTADVAGGRRSAELVAAFLALVREPARPTRSNDPDQRLAPGDDPDVGVVAARAREAVRE